MIARERAEIQEISIHASRVGGDYARRALPLRARYFNPRLPGGRRRLLRKCCGERKAISIHASRVGGDQPAKKHWEVKTMISIHASRVGGDELGFRRGAAARISIHASRVGGDSAGYRPALVGRNISIHASRVGGDRARIASSRHRANFNPRLPGGRRLPLAERSIKAILFQSTPPGWEATAWDRHSGADSNHFNPRLPGGRRLRESAVRAL